MRLPSPLPVPFDEHPFSVGEALRAGITPDRLRRLRLLVVRAGSREPELNVERRTAEGLYLGKPDLSWSVEKAAVDFEGDGHRTDRTQRQRDIDRRERFVDHGWSYHRVTDRHLRHPLSGQLLARLRRSLER